MAFDIKSNQIILLLCSTSLFLVLQLYVLLGLPLIINRTFFYLYHVAAFIILFFIPFYISRRSSTTSVVVSRPIIPSITHNASYDDSSDRDALDKIADGLEYFSGVKGNFTSPNYINPESWLDSLDHIKVAADLSYWELLEVIEERVMAKAKRWYVAVGTRCNSWEEFQSAFRKRFSDL